MMLALVFGGTTGGPPASCPSLFDAALNAALDAALDAAPPLPPVPAACTGMQCRVVVACAPPNPNQPVLQLPLTKHKRIAKSNSEMIAHWRPGSLASDGLVIRSGRVSLLTLTHGLCVQQDTNHALLSVDASACTAAGPPCDRPERKRSPAGSRPIWARKTIDSDLEKVPVTVLPNFSTRIHVRSCACLSA